MPALPHVVTRRPLRTFRPRDLRDTVSNPRVQVARWVEQGRVVRLADGYAMAVPDDQGPEWRPSIEAAAAGIGAAIAGPRNAALMGLSAARIHQALPRALSVALVALAKQHRPVRLRDSGHVIFAARDLARLDLRVETVEFDRALVTTPEQTVLDLAARPGLGGEPDEARQAALALTGQCNDEALWELARHQRALAPLERLLGRTRP